MKICKKGQGATEYLLMLAAVLIIVAIAVYYITSAAPSSIITGEVRLVNVAGDDNDIQFTPSTSMVPTTIPSGEWSWAVYRAGTAAAICSGTGAVALERGIPATLETLTAVQPDVDTLKITYKGTAYTAGTVSYAG